jgi:uncharacterized protein (TIGR02145 family)
MTARRFHSQNSKGHGRWERAKSSGGPLVGLPFHGTATISQRYSGREGSGFSALPGGNRNNNNGNFNNEGNNGNWWSSSPNGSNNAWNRNLNSDNDNVNRNNNNQRNGLSVRCVRDDFGIGIHGPFGHVGASCLL